jgi:cyclopropane-fatty-acyl-phospholipid synthase
VLDIGSGWGGLALYLASVARARVRGITLSDHQFAIARQRAADSGLGERIEFALEDYRDTRGRFDRIVSVGMLEHVGIGYLPAFFAKAFELLAEDGVCLVHAIGRSEGPGVTNPWIAKYIFPGVYVPALSELMPAVERAGFLVADIEILRLHYADTLKAWRERFLARRDEARHLYDERFCRMWEFYLASCEMAFRHHGMMVFQIQLVKREGVVPPTRRYIAEREARLSAAEREGRPQLRLAGT